MNEPILVSKKEAAQVLSVSLRTVDNLIAAKEPAVRRLGRRCLIPRAALEAFARRDHSTIPIAAHGQTHLMKCTHKDCNSLRALGCEYCAFHQRLIDDKKLATPSADHSEPISLSEGPAVQIQKSEA
jgi:excisionase family DNA binding protein